VISFRVKNKPLTYWRVVTKAFRVYLENFMKIFLDYFTMYSDMESGMEKLKLCFQKCREYGINLNLDKCAFMVFLSMILGFIISKERKLPDPKKTQAIVNMPPPRNPQHIQIFNRMVLQIFYQ